MNEPTVIIYALKEPGSNHIRYIGKTRNMGHRMHLHKWDAKNNNTHKANWLSKLAKLGVAPEIEILNEVPEDNWSFWEQAHIKLYRELGHDLTNATNGGEGVTMTPEIREKISQSRKGWVPTPENRKNMSLAQMGKKRGPNSPEHCEKISLSKKGIQTTEFTPEIRHKLSLAQKARRERERGLT